MNKEPKILREKCPLCGKPVRSNQFCAINKKTNWMIEHFGCHKKKNEKSERIKISPIYTRFYEKPLISNHPLIRGLSKKITKMYQTGKIPASFKNLGKEVDETIDCAAKQGRRYQQWKGACKMAPNWTDGREICSDIGRALLPLRWELIVKILEAKNRLNFASFEN